MNIENKLTAAVLEGIKQLYGQEVPEKMVQLQKTKKEFEGHLTLVVFPFLKMSKKGPEQTAQEIGEYLKNNEPAIADFNVIKGFLNLTIASGVWVELLNTINKDEKWGLKEATENSPLVMIEYSSPNTNKPLHLGHVRNNLLGNALANVMAANGNKVVKTNIVNDRGIHICKSMLAWLKYGNGETPESSGKKGDHLIGDYYVAFDKHYKAEVKELTAKFMAEGMNEEEAKAKAEAESPLMLEAREMLRKWEANDPEVRGLWKMMNDWVYAGFDETYKMMGVSFDKIYYESETYLEGKEKVMEGLEKGFFYKKEDGSVWADLTAEGLDHKLLLRGDGTSVYMTQDIGTAKLRFQDYPINKMIYVVGNEQNYHFQVLSILLDKLGFEWGKDLVHFSYGMVELPEGKMKSREGTVVDADDLMEAMIETAKETSAELGKLDGLSKEEAVIEMVDSNLQREHILPSEKARAYKMKMDAMKKQGERRDLTSNPTGGKSIKGVETAEIIGEEAGESANTVRRYIRLNELTKELLEFVDEGKIGMRPAVELSYLQEDEMRDLVDFIDDEEVFPSHAQTIRMKALSKEGKLDTEAIREIMFEEKPNQKAKVKIPMERIEKYFPTGTSQQQMEDTIVKALALYRQRQKENRDAR